MAEGQHPSSPEQIKRNDAAESRSIDSVLQFVASRPSNPPSPLPRTYDPSMAAFSDDELDAALDEALAREASTLVWMIVDEIERRDGLAEL